MCKKYLLAVTNLSYCCVALTLNNRCYRWFVDKQLIQRLFCSSLRLKMMPKPDKLLFVWLSLCIRTDANRKLNSGIFLSEMTCCDLGSCFIYDRDKNTFITYIQRCHIHSIAFQFWHILLLLNWWFLALVNLALIAFHIDNSVQRKGICEINKSRDSRELVLQQVLCKQTLAAWIWFEFTDGVHSVCNISP